MKKVIFDKLDLELYSETLENGLDIYIVPRTIGKNIYATFTTKYGSIHNEFIPHGESDYVKVPNGIAHFLEHKMFEQENGEDPFSLYSKNGSNCNAFTTFYNTTYLFSGTKFFEENINLLLNFVQDPYFTEENVEKEKGIIVEEIKMYKDEPYVCGEEILLENAFFNHSVNVSIAGSEDSVVSITKEDLYTCYKTFYHPSNMFLVITGNVEPEEVIKIIKENQDKKEFEKSNKIEIREVNEPNEVKVKEATICMNVVIPKAFIGYKFNIENLNLTVEEITVYLNILADLKFSNVATFTEQLLNNEKISSDIEYVVTRAGKHLFMMILADTKKPTEFISSIKEEITKWDIKEEDFNRKKKAAISSFLYMSDNVYNVNRKVMNDVIFKGGADSKLYDKYQRLNFNDLKNIFDNLSFDNNTTLTINPNKTK
ncbi:MAG: EF-P 5-aminopentanol modification-associated protein YfmH [Bacilli bacterium]